MPSTGWEDWARISYVLPSPAEGNSDFSSSFRPVLRATTLMNYFLYESISQNSIRIKPESDQKPEEVTIELLKHFKRKLQLLRVCVFVTKPMQLHEKHIFLEK